MYIHRTVHAISISTVYQVLSQLEDVFRLAYEEDCSEILSLFSERVVLSRELVVVGKRCRVTISHRKILYKLIRHHEYIN
jgi:hypothetical protein